MAAQKTVLGEKKKAASGGGWRRGELKNRRKS